MSALPDANANAAGIDRLTFRPVTPARWRDLAALFEARGGPKSCWCMVWRATAAEAKDTSGRARRAALEGRVRSGVPVGILGYRDGTPVAWCSIAPRATYRQLGGIAVPGEAEDGVWSIVCFFVSRSIRGQGVMPRLLAAAVDHARANGATALEAYPVDPDSPSYRFMGFVPAFEKAGFREVGRAGRRRHVMRLDIVGDGAAHADVAGARHGRALR